MSTVRRRSAVATLVAIAAFGCTACGVPLQDDASPLSPDQLPDGLRPSASTIVGEQVPDTSADQEPVDVWFVREDRLASARHRIDPPVTPERVLAELLTGPTEAEQDRSLRSAVPDAAVVTSVSVAGGVATVGLAPEFSDIPASDQVLAVGQLVLTLTDQRGIGRVRFVVDDAQIAVPLPSGESSDQSVSRDDYVSLAAAG